MARTRSPGPLTVLAWFNVCLHLVGLGFAALGMMPGTPLVSLPERLDYLAGNPVGWRWGWAIWMACAVLLISFLALVVGRLGTDLARVGLVIAAVGAGFDLFCDAVFLLVFPMVASWEPRPEQLFLLMERATGIGSLVIANGAYSVGILLISLALPGPALPASGVRGLTHNSGAALVGLGVATAGLLLAGAGFTGVPEHAQWLTGPTMVLFCIWVILVARDLKRDAGPR